MSDEAAYTQEPSAENAYPGYVNFSVLDDGRVKVTVRGSQLKGLGEKDLARPGELAQLVIDGRCFVQLMEDANKLQLPETVMDNGAQPTLDLPFAGDAWPGGKAEGAKELLVSTDADIDEVVEQKHRAQMDDLADEDERRAAYGEPFDDKAPRE